MINFPRALRLLLGDRPPSDGGPASLRLRSRRGAVAPGRRRRIADALSAVLPPFAFVVVLGVAVAWVILVAGVLRGGGRKAAPRDARRKGGGVRILGVTLPNLRRWSAGGDHRSAAPPPVAAANALRSQEILDAIRPESPVAAANARRSQEILDAIRPESPVADRKIPESRIDVNRQAILRVDTLLLPGPVIVVGFPKSGTTSINSYFRCGGRKSSHFACEAYSPEFDDLPPAEARMGAAASVSPPGDSSRNCRLPKGAGGPAASAGDFPLCGLCVRRNILRRRPPLEGCGNYEVWAELDSAEHPLPTPLANTERRRRDKEDKAREEAARKVQEQVKQLEKEGGEEISVEEALELARVARQDAEEGEALSVAEDEAEVAEDDYGGVQPLCSYPQITHLDEIHAAYPNATFILNLRPVEKWIQSISKWTGDRRRSGMGYLRQVLTRCDFPGLPAGKGGDDADLKAFYDGHSQRVRDFVHRHPSHALVEVNIEEADAGKVMEEAFGISSMCWTVRNASPGAGGGRHERRERFQRIREVVKEGVDEYRPSFADDDVVGRLRQRRGERMEERRQQRDQGEGRPEMGREEGKRERRRIDQLDQDRANDIREKMMEIQRRRRERHGRSRFRYARYPWCTDTEDLFQSSS